MIRKFARTIAGSVAELVKATSRHLQTVFSVVAIIISLIALVQTRASNEIQRQMQELAQWVDFRVEFSTPSNVTNRFEKEMLLRDIKIYNDGFRMKKIHGISITTILQVLVADVDEEGGSFVSVPCLSEDYYCDSRHTFQTKGLLYSARGAPLQRGIQMRLKQYADRHPDRLCRILPADWIKIDYDDIQGVRHEQWLMNSCMVSEEEFNMVMDRVKEFKKVLENRRIVDFDRILDCCYEKGLEATKNYRKVH